MFTTTIMDYVPLFRNGSLQLSDVASLIKRVPFVIRSTNISSNLLGVNAQIVITKEIGSVSSEHSVFKCRVEFGNRFIPDCVVKLKKMNGALHFLSEIHALQMVSNYSMLNECIYESEMQNSIQVNNYILVHSEDKFGQKYCLWIEEYLPSFQKFLRWKTDSDLNRRLSLSNRNEIKELQLWMIENEYSPLVDPQGYYDRKTNTIILSDIETVESLSQKFKDVDSDSCLNYIESQSSSSNCTLC